MSKSTSIQWTDSTLNFIMGCGGCELYQPIANLMFLMSVMLKGLGFSVPKKTLLGILDECVDTLRNSLAIQDQRELVEFYVANTSNLYLLRVEYSNAVARMLGNDSVAIPVRAFIEQQIKCYAAKLHLMRGFDVRSPDKKTNAGYAPLFELPKIYPQRIAEPATWKDLKGIERPDKPWIKGQSRMVFISDMGDAFTSDEFFDVSKQAVSAFSSGKASRHLYQWLTKRPATMAKFSKEIDGFPPNFCAMTTVTAPKYLHRVDELLKVNASLRGLSIEPLFERLPRLDLKGIDWLIVGGESGAKKSVSSFDCDWVMELREQCEDQGVAFFVKQLGSRPIYNGHALPLVDKHGGDWNEWPSELRIRQFPSQFTLP